jgi:hypothetical protein
LASRDVCSFAYSAFGDTAVIVTTALSLGYVALPNPTSSLQLTITIILNAPFNSFDSLPKRRFLAIRYIVVAMHRVEGAQLPKDVAPTLDMANAIAVQ